MRRGVRRVLIAAIAGLLLFALSGQAYADVNGLWIGPEKISFAGEQDTVQTWAILYQESPTVLWLSDEGGFGKIKLIASGNKWILPSPIATTVMGVTVTVASMSLEFPSASRMMGTIDFEAVGNHGQAELSHTKQSCPAIDNGALIANLSGAGDSLRCYSVDMPSGSENLTVQTAGGSGDCDLYLAYHRPDFDFYTSEAVGNGEFISPDPPHPGKWYIGLYGFTSYAGLTLSVLFDLPKPEANFNVSNSTGKAPLQVTFSDLSSGIIDSWAWDFGDGGFSAEQNPTHTYTKPGVYTVTLTVSNLTGSDLLKKQDAVIVRGPAMPWLPILLDD